MGIGFLVSWCLGFFTVNCAVVDNSQTANDLKIQALLGKGGYSNVYLAEFKGKQVAVKVIPKIGDLIKYQEDVDLVANEILAMEAVTGSPHTISLIQWLSDICNIYLVMEYEGLGSGTKVMALVSSTENFTLHPEIAKRYFISLLDAVAWLQSKKLRHMDIQAANVLIKDDGTLKLADFGSAEFEDRLFAPDEVPIIYPPEVVLRKKPYTLAGDVWGIGATMLQLITGRTITTWGMLTLESINQGHEELFEFLKQNVLVDDDGKRKTIQELLTTEQVQNWRLQELSFEANEQLKVIASPVEPMSSYSNVLFPQTLEHNSQALDRLLQERLVYLRNEINEAQFDWLEK